MKIVVINTAASRTGAVTILKEFVQYIQSNDAENEWVFILSDNLIEESNNVKVIVLKHLKEWHQRLLFDFYSGKKLMRKLDADVVFSMQNTTLYHLDMPQVLYLHQALPFSIDLRYSFIKKAERSLAIHQKLIGSLIKIGLKKADAIVVQTQWMKESAIRYIQPIHTTIHVVPPNLTFENRVRLEGFKLNHFIYPTSRLHYKNNQVFIEACALLNQENSQILYHAILTTDVHLSMDNFISIAGLPREEILNQLETSVLVFPSIIESYGLPLAEARRIGTIILAADTVFAREILAGYPNAYFFNPSNPHELKELMQRCIDQQIILEEVLETDTVSKGWESVREVILEVSATASDYAEIIS